MRAGSIAESEANAVELGRTGVGEPGRRRRKQPRQIQAGARAGPGSARGLAWVRGEVEASSTGWSMGAGNAHRGSGTVPWGLQGAPEGFQQHCPVVEAAAFSQAQRPSTHPTAAYHWPPRGLLCSVPILAGAQTQLFILLFCFMHLKMKVLPLLFTRHTYFIWSLEGGTEGLTNLPGQHQQPGGQ